MRCVQQVSSVQLRKASAQSDVDVASCTRCDLATSDAASTESTSTDRYAHSVPASPSSAVRTVLSDQPPLPSRSIGSPWREAIGTAHVDARAAQSERRIGCTHAACAPAITGVAAFHPSASLLPVALASGRRDGCRSTRVAPSGSLRLLVASSSADQPTDRPTRNEFEPPVGVSRTSRRATPYSLLKVEEQHRTWQSTTIRKRMGVTVCTF